MIVFGTLFLTVDGYLSFVRLYRDDPKISHGKRKANGVICPPSQLDLVTLLLTPPSPVNKLIFSEIKNHLIRWMRNYICQIPNQWSPSCGQSLQWGFTDERSTYRCSTTCGTLPKYNHQHERVREIPSIGVLVLAIFKDASNWSLHSVVVPAEGHITGVTTVGLDVNLQKA